MIDSQTAEQKVINHMMGTPGPLGAGDLLDLASCSARTIRRVLTHLHETKQIHIVFWEETKKGHRPSWKWGQGSDAPRPDLPLDQAQTTPDAGKPQIKRHKTEEDEISEMEEELRVEKARQIVHKRIDDIVSGAAERDPLEMCMLSWGATGSSKIQN